MEDRETELAEQQQALDAARTKLNADLAEVAASRRELQKAERVLEVERGRVAQLRSDAEAAAEASAMSSEERVRGRHRRRVNWHLHGSAR